MQEQRWASNFHASLDIARFGQHPPEFIVNILLISIGLHCILNEQKTLLSELFKVFAQKNISHMKNVLCHTCTQCSGEAWSFRNESLHFLFSASKQPSFAKSSIENLIRESNNTITVLLLVSLKEILPCWKKPMKTPPLTKISRFIYLFSNEGYKQVENILWNRVSAATISRLRGYVRKLWHCSSWCKH